MANKSKPTMEEKTEYDNFIGKKGQDKNKPSSLVTFLGEDEEEFFAEPWEEHWQDMPEYEQEENGPWKTINVHFRNKEDFEEFGDIIKQHMSEKTKTIWHPKLHVTKNSLLRWVEEDDEEDIGDTE